MTPLLGCKSSHRQNGNKWMWLFSKKIKLLLRTPKFKFHVIFTCYKISFSFRFFSQPLFACGLDTNWLGAGFGPQTIICRPCSKSAHMFRGLPSRDVHQLKDQFHRASVLAPSRRLHNARTLSMHTSSMSSLPHKKKTQKPGF